MDILNRLDQLSVDDRIRICGNLLGAINIDGGFSHKRNSLTGPESSSVILSYYCYLALESLNIIHLSTNQKNNLAVFIANSQFINSSVFVKYGGFFDSEFFTEVNIETTFYGVSLLDYLNRKDLINISALF